VIVFVLYMLNVNNSAVILFLLIVESYGSRIRGGDSAHHPNLLVNDHDSVAEYEW
jgi:hypothetical protein